MSINGVIIQSNRLVQNGIKQQFLKDGSSVLVRISVDKGNGQYEAYVGGVKTTVTSKTPLQAGMTFVSVIHEKNGVITLSKSQNPDIQQTSGLQILQNQNIASLLESLGLPADDLSFAMLQQMKQLEMKLDSSLMNKIRNIALRFKNKEKSAMQLLLILAEKGIDATSEDLLQLIQQYDGDFDENSKSKNQDSKNQFELINKINQTEGKWYLLPYEILDLNKKESETNSSVIGKGCIKVFLASEKIKMLNFQCGYENSNFIFNLNFDKGFCTGINMNISSDEKDYSKESKKLVENLKNMLLKSGKNIDVNWCQKDLIEGTAASMENIYSFEEII